MQNSIGDKATGLAMQIREWFWKVGVCNIVLVRREGSMAVIQWNEESQGVEGTGVGFHSCRILRERGG